jgi:colicin import membrane protein
MLPGCDPRQQEDDEGDPRGGERKRDKTMSKELGQLELATISPGVTAVQLFSGGIDAVLDGIEAKVRAEKLDVSTAQGRDEIRSLAFKVRRTKTALDEEGKRLTEEWRKSTAMVNADRKKAAERLDALAEEEVRKPLTDFENKEKLRVAGHEAALADLTGLVPMLRTHPAMSAKLLREYLDDYRKLQVGREWEEFAQRANVARIETLNYVNERIEAADKHEAEQAELERLRREDAERRQCEHEDRLRAEAAEAARIETERKAKAAADAERKRVEAEAELVRLAHERAAKEAKAKIEAAEAARIASEKRAADEKREARERLERAERKAKQDAELAVERERGKIEAERLAEERERVKREADEKIRAKVRTEVIEDLRGFDTPAAIADALLGGRVRHIKVSF